MSQHAASRRRSTKSIKKTSIALWAMAASLCLIAAPQGFAQDAPEASVQENPFEDPNLIYLEADQLIDNQETGQMIARGEVEARYGERILRADEVVYTLETGQVVARGNVTILNEDGSTQYADEIELSEEMEAGIAENFTARLAEGGVVAARYAVRRSDEGVDLYNAYYTACGCADEAHAHGETPTWRIKARRVRQDKADQMIYYRDAVFELKGIPVFYTPFLAHPDPSAGRRSGLLIPGVGRSGRYGLFYEQPYYWAISPHSELTLTPRIMERVNPLMQARYRKKFYSGDLDIQGSFTYDDWYDSDGDEITDADVFLDPSEDLRGERLRSHILGRGSFEISENWDWGFGLEYATDDLYLRRYDLDEQRDDFGLWWADNRRLSEQVYVQGQSEDYRLSASAAGFLSLRTNVTRRDVDGLINVSREDDSLLPVALPKIEYDHYFTDPALGGRVHVSSDVSLLQRANGDDYARGTAAVEWSKPWITNNGINITPFASVRADQISLSTDGYPGRINSELPRVAANQAVTAFDDDNRDFTRTLGQVGFDARWPFYKPGNNVDFIIEPRVQVTGSFGDSKIDEFIRTVELTRTNAVGNVTDVSSYFFTTAEDGLSIDLDHSLLFQSNKATGYDFWQEGVRADIGASFQAHWGGDSHASVFLGQSYVSGQDFDYALGTGLGGDTSDLVALFEATLFDKFEARTRLRVDEDGFDVRRIDTELGYRGERLSGSLRYYKIDNPFSAVDLPDQDPFLDALTPPEEVSGNVRFKLTDTWSASYSLFRDLDAEITRSQRIGLTYGDCCATIAFQYTKNNTGSGLTEDSDGFRVQFSFRSLGDLRPD